MKDDRGRGCVPRQVTCGLMAGIVCSVTLATPPAPAAAEEPASLEAPAADSTTHDRAAMEEARRDLQEARAKLDAAEARLDELAPEPEVVSTTPAKTEREEKFEAREPTPEQSRSADPVVGVGLVGKDGKARKLQFSLNDDGTLYFRLAMWLQVWARAIQLNPGTTILDNPDTPELEGQDAWYGDVGIRRARVLMFGQIFPRVFLLMHFGINNQTFRNARKPQLYFHDLWAEFDVWKDFIDIGAGLLYWNGVSRMTSASTITFMSLDAPIVNWPTIERTDQFARQLGFYAKGNIFGLDYRVAVVRPFTTTVPPLTPGGPANYNNFQNTWAYSGYFQYMFWDIEPNTLPYTVGTWIGTKRVLNVGAGYHIHPDGVAYITEDGDLETQPLIATGVDMFADVPLSKRPNGGAITGYGVYYYYDFGPNNVRNIGIMNPGDPGSGTSFNGPGNAYPVIGTSHTFYGQLGWLLPWKINQVRFQPYLVSQMSKFQALEDPMFQFGVGGNVFIHGHNAKVTLEYRNRPIFDAETLRVDSRKGNSFVLQFHLFI